MRYSVTGVIAVSLHLALVSPLISAQDAQGPEYADPETRAIVEQMVTAHGGTEAWNRVESFSFMFFTKNSGNPEPWLSRETIEPRSGRAYLDWPVLDASIVWDGSTVWAVGWEVPLSPGFFTRLTYSFVTLPWQTQQSGVRLEATGTDRIPNDETEYVTVRMTYDRQTPNSPGNYYRLFIDPDSQLLRAVEFNITHPGLAANPNQPLGPNLHVFEEHREVVGLTLPVFYISYGFNQRNASTSNAVHYVFDLSLDQPFDEARMERPSGAIVDHVTLGFWEEERP
jgi:hypothetical protein